MTNTHQQQGGFANLMGIMIVTMVGMTAVLSLLTLDSTELDRGLTEDAARTARTNADSCGELALLQLRSNSAYAGVDERALQRGTCIATTTNSIDTNGDHAAIILASGFVDDVSQTHMTTLTIVDATSSPAMFTNITHQEVMTP